MDEKLNEELDPKCLLDYAFDGTSCINEEIKDDLIFSLGEAPEYGPFIYVAILLLRNDLEDNIRQAFSEFAFKCDDTWDCFNKESMGYPSISLGSEERDSFIDHCVVCGDKHTIGDIVYANCPKHNNYNRCTGCRNKLCPMCSKKEPKNPQEMDDSGKAPKPDEPQEPKLQKPDEPQESGQQKESDQPKESDNPKESDKPQKSGKPKESDKSQKSDNPKESDKPQKSGKPKESDERQKAQDDNSAKLPGSSQPDSTPEDTQDKTENPSNAHGSLALSPVESIRLQRQRDLEKELLDIVDLGQFKQGEIDFLAEPYSYSTIEVAVIEDPKGRGKINVSRKQFERARALALHQSLGTDTDTEDVPVVDEESSNAEHRNILANDSDSDSEL